RARASNRLRVPLAHYSAAIPPPTTPLISPQHRDRAPLSPKPPPPSVRRRVADWSHSGASGAAWSFAAPPGVHLTHPRAAPTYAPPPPRRTTSAASGLHRRSPSA